MKKMICTLIVIISFVMGRACEICGCGVGNYYIGLLPQFSHRFAGVRYHFNSFKTRITDDPSQFSNDFYQTIELWGGWNIGRKFQVLAILPYNINHQVSDEGISNLRGLGDIAVMGNYKVYSSKTSDSPVSQGLWLGAGLKLPTGKFEIETNDPDAASIANRQLGSGSVDLLLNVMYNVRFGKLGINSNVDYKIDGSKADYKFGNKFSANSFVYYAITSPKTVISPNAGLLYENLDQSELQGSKLHMTGGSILRTSIGAEISLSKVSVGFNLQMPITQNFAHDQTREKIKGMMHISFSL
jgi:hypothetical protein